MVERAGAGKEGKREAQAELPKPKAHLKVPKYSFHEGLAVVRAWLKREGLRHTAQALEEEVKEDAEGRFAEPAGGAVEDGIAALSATAGQEGACDEEGDRSGDESTLEEDIDEPTACPIAKLELPEHLQSAMPSARQDGAGQWGRGDIDDGKRRSGKGLRSNALDGERRARASNDRSRQDSRQGREGNPPPPRPSRVPRLE